MRVVVAGSGVAGLAASLALARPGHEVVVLERDVVDPDASPLSAFEVERRGIPHCFQPHAFLPRGRRVLSEWAPDVLDTLVEVGADPQDVALKLHGPRRPGDEDLVYLWVRRPLIEWAPRRATTESAVDIRAGVRVAGLLTSDDGATGVAIDEGEPVRGDLVVDALGRYRCPPGWPRPRPSRSTRARSTTAATSRSPTASSTSTRRSSTRAATSGTWASTSSGATTGRSR